MKFLKIGLTILFLFVVVWIGRMLYWANTAKIESDKDFYEINILEDDVADYTIFEMPSGKYASLNVLSENTRDVIACYMSVHNLKLKTGKHTFHRINYTIDQLLFEDFSFEPK